MKNKNKDGPKNKSLKISANEVNSFVYCPYQWYYNRYYGQAALKEKYKSLKDKNSKVESQFKKGLRFHKRYYMQYRMQQMLKLVIILIIVGFSIWMVIKWH
ncbi:hypothetical protein [Cellulosilyticum ruminicola]|uniref:hypothetical protein n=1 Tax=Cellulosilyticum ruminicola TaxID=425254 RepID=UPI0006D26087|nr:hypothetical protein [Cellulosilyticum ruminicola]